MFDRDDYNAPEGRAAPTFLIGVLLLAICAIFTYLAIGGAFLDQGTQTAVYTPQVIDEGEAR
ncbi:hypothetical protein [Sinorhizobium psoraleae]|uniref:Uncharacterized protein n=1 Tax=Sinorhizobium psoraleae TaxID=520838 RepID=A0ABT4KAU8_9HYPH|nr:hypothetical protein [Sinorhizobium psoraleae]MCZ4088964.1 hypothetical protein [Sinorhizobium psoraleae]